MQFNKGIAKTPAEAINLQKKKNEVAMLSDKLKMYLATLDGEHIDG